MFSQQPGFSHATLLLRFSLLTPLSIENARLSAWREVQVVRQPPRPASEPPWHLVTLSSLLLSSVSGLTSRASERESLRYDYFIFFISSTLLLLSVFSWFRPDRHDISFSQRRDSSAAAWAAISDVSTPAAGAISYRYPYFLSFHLEYESFLVFSGFFFMYFCRDILLLLQIEEMILLF